MVCSCVIGTSRWLHYISLPLRRPLNFIFRYIWKVLIGFGIHNRFPSPLASLS